MARGRLISRTLGSSRKFAALRTRAGKLGAFAQALYPLLVACSDDYGRMAGDAFTVKLTVFPSAPQTEDDFTAALRAMHAERLICLYVADGIQVLAIEDFEAHQPGLQKRTKEKFPAPPVNLRESAGNDPLLELNSLEGIGTQSNRTALTRVEDLFDAFWAAYPKKKSKADAEKAWRKLAPSPELSQRIQASIAAQRMTADWQKNGGQFIPYPASWLNAKRWEDETDRPAAAAMGSRTLALVNATAGFLAGGKS